MALNVRCSLGALLGNELENVLPWLRLFEPFFDEIIILNDSNDGSVDLVKSYFECYGLTWKAKIIESKLAGDFASARNLVQRESSKDWILHIDFDERISIRGIFSIIEMVKSFDQHKVDICGFPRLNTLNGVVVNDVPRTLWTTADLGRLKNENLADPGYVRNSDVQYRLVRKTEVWVNKVHECAESVYEMLNGYPKENIIIERNTWLLHHKTLDRQIRQNQFYGQLGGVE